MTSIWHRSWLLAALLLFAQLGLAGHVHAPDEHGGDGHGVEHCLVCPLHADAPWHTAPAASLLPLPTVRAKPAVATPRLARAAVFPRYAIRAPPVIA